VKNIINAIQIDPFKKSVKQITFDANSLEEIYKNLSNENVACDIFEVYSPGQNMNLLIDEEGRLKPNNKRFRLMWGKYPQQDFCGIGIVVGPSSNGNFTETRFTVPNIYNIVVWED
jgi:hypothetical protein